MKKIVLVVLLVVVIYLEYSFLEWFLHRYFMHNQNIGGKTARDHLIHHEKVDYNMSLKDHDERGLSFSWCTLIKISFVMVFVLKLTFSLFGVKIRFLYVIGIQVALALFYKVAWDVLHRRFHQVNTDLSLSKTSPILFRILFENHANHHLQKGDRKGNFNIILLGADHLLGTYNREIKNLDSITGECGSNDEKICDIERTCDDVPFNLKFHTCT